MDALIAPVLAVALAANPGAGDALAGRPPDRDPSPGQAAVRDWTVEISAAARLSGLSEGLIQAVMAAESGGFPAAVSPKGAIGLMQLMPQTYAALAHELGLGNDPFAPGDNVLAGAVFLRKMRDRFGSPTFLAAYNAGPECLDAVLAGLWTLPEESRIFMEKVMASLATAEGQPVARPAGVVVADRGPGGLFFGPRDGPHAAGEASGWREIFVPHSTSADAP